MQNYNNSSKITFLFQLIRPPNYLNIQFFTVQFQSTLQHKNSENIFWIVFTIKCNWPRRMRYFNAYKHGSSRHWSRNNSAHVKMIEMEKNNRRKLDSEICNEWQLCENYSGNVKIRWHYVIPKITGFISLYSFFLRGSLESRKLGNLCNSDWEVTAINKELQWQNEKKWISLAKDIIWTT